MKKIIIILFFACLSAALITSCSKDPLAPVPIQNIGDNAGQPAKNIASPVTPPEPVLGHIINTVATLTGKWQLVRDSVSSSNSGGTQPGASYTGTTADSYEFTADGKLYIQEKGLADTANYTINTDQSITVNYLVYNGAPVVYGSHVTNFTQVGLTGNHVTLVTSMAGTMSVNTRYVELKR
ncbi:MAG TPA: hypothetical protein VK671_14910 [Mucilaginibacter sp.]|jgi:hypothetical protein|nr:hypothetical protein [Mucilaginibacter sp.]